MNSRSIYKTLILTTRLFYDTFLQLSAVSKWQILFDFSNSVCWNRKIYFWIHSNNFSEVDGRRWKIFVKVSSSSCTSWCCRLTFWSFMNFFLLLYLKETCFECPSRSESLQLSMNNSGRKNISNSLTKIKIKCCNNYYKARLTQFECDSYGTLWKKRQKEELFCK